MMTKDSKPDSPSVIVNCMTPGACKSDFHRENSSIGGIIQSILDALIARTTEAGSRTLVAGIAAGEESHGAYMADCKVEEYVSFSFHAKEFSTKHADHKLRPGPFVLGTVGKALQETVWDQLVRQLETIQPGISDNI